MEKVKTNATEQQQRGLDEIVFEICGWEQVENKLKQQHIGNARIFGGLKVNESEWTNVQHSSLNASQNIRPDDADVRFNVCYHRHQTALDAV